MARTSDNSPLPVAGSDELALSLLRASTDALLDPQVLLEALRDTSGQVVDFLYREVNQATCDYLGLSREELIGHGIVETMPGMRETLFPAYLECFNSGDPLFLNDVSYTNEVLADTRRYDIRVTRATPASLTLTWRDITERSQLTERNRILNQELQQHNDRLKVELDSAAAYMASIMPTGLYGRVTVSSRYLPSRELGGDCFSYYWLDDDRFLVELIDVSGHGLEPALLAASVHNLIRSGSLSRETLLVPEAVLTELNHLFAMENQNDHYLTMWYGIYEAPTRTLRYASAGAPPALAFNPETVVAAAVTEIFTTAAPVGAFEDTVFSSGTYHVPPGCRILIYSDGASEINLGDGEQLTAEEFKKVATKVAASSGWSLDDLIDDLRALTPSGAFEDDCSLIQLQFD
jgi:serine phosphatase RsbU (regulator of sigma subunit)